MSDQDFIYCENLVKIYKIANLEIFALQGLDLSVATGELMGIVGASGSGKSTLLNILGGLDHPSAGQVWVNGTDLLKLSSFSMDRYRRNQVGFVWQQGSRNLIPYLTAEENILLPMLLAGKGGRKAKQRASRLLEAVDLVERRYHRLGQLSGGEQQRVAIAVALANQPKLLLADEPTGEVDSETAQTIYQAFRQLNHEFGVTMLIVSHDPGIARYVDRVVAVRDGKLATETIRREGKSINDEEDETEFHELIVLDSAGRLQIPKEYLSKFHIQRRAQLEITDRGILVVPSPDEQASDKGSTNNQEEDQASQFGLRAKLGYWRAKISSIRKRSR